MTYDFYCQLESAPSGLLRHIGGGGGVVKIATTRHGWDSSLADESFLCEAHMVFVRKLPGATL